MRFLAATTLLSVVLVGFSAGCGDGVAERITPNIKPVATQLRISTAADTTTGLALRSGMSTDDAIAVTLQDASGAPVALDNVPVRVAFVSTSGAVVPGVAVTSNALSTTDAYGVALFSGITVFGKAGPGRLMFTSGTLTAAGVSVRVLAGGTSASLSTFQLSADSALVGESIVATVQLFDSAANKLGAGHTVAFSNSGGVSTGTWTSATFVPGDSSYQASFVAVTPGGPSVASVSVDGRALSTTRALRVWAPAMGSLTFTINAALTFPISRFIYGANFVDDVGSYGGAALPIELTVNRVGGNRMSAYNWENNYSNSGLDNNFSNDRFLHPSSTAPGEAIRARAALSFARNQAFIATVPMLGYVAGDACDCNVGATNADRTQRLATHFKVSRAFKGSPLAAVPDANDAFVYQDEFVHWWESVFPGRATHATAPVFFTLDNEPDAWHSTHREIQSNLNDNPDTPRLLTYNGFSDTSIEYARAIKNVSPSALIFGPGVATYAGYVTGGRYPSPDPEHGTENFLDVYLDRMRAAESTYGKRLLDVLDLHWYSEASTGPYTVSNDYAPQDSAMIEARVQAPRSLWDPTYTERSWVSDVTAGPIRLLPRIKEQIAAHYPGTRIAITEYFYGRGGDISGGIAQADALGIFGREGVFAATLWPNAGIYAPPYLGDGTKAYAFAFAAFRMFLNFDGAGGRFGDIGVQAATSDVAGTSVYASRNSAGQLVLVAINKSRTMRDADIVLQGTGGFTQARVYALTAAAPHAVRGANLTVSAGGRTTYRMPALSVSTLVITP